MCLVTDEFGVPLPTLARARSNAPRWTRPRKGEVPTESAHRSKGASERRETSRASDGTTHEAFCVRDADAFSRAHRRSTSADAGFDFHDVSRNAGSVPKTPTSRDNFWDFRARCDADASDDARVDDGKDDDDDAFARFGRLTRRSIERAMRERGCSALEALARLSREDA